MKALSKVKIIRTSTVPISLNILLKGQLNYLNQFYDIVAVSGAGKDLDTVKEREGVRTISVEIQRPISPFKDLISLWKLYKLFKKEQPSMVHSITPKAGLLSMLAAKMAGIPVRAHTFTGLIFPTKTGLMQKLLIQMDRLLCLCATKIIPEGEGVKQDLIKFNITKKPLSILANGNVNGIDTDYFSPDLFSIEQKNKLKQKYGINENDFVFVFVGRMVGDKGINELISAYQQLNKENTKLLLVGPFEHELDPLNPETIDLLQQNKNIISVGWQSDIRPFLAISHCLAFPSYREGFPNVVMQAGAMGLPAIVTNINGCNEIIIEQKNGVIIPPKDTTSLYTAMCNMLNNKTNYSTLKSMARKMITQRYRQEVVWEAIHKEYKNLLA